MNRHEPKRAREAAVFKSNRSQAIRIPKELAFPEGVRRVTVTPVDGGLLLKPIEAGWAEYFARADRLDKESASQMLEAVGHDPPPEQVDSLD